MHPHATLLEKLYTSSDGKDHQGMASCYHPEASFDDIAFNLRGKKQIHAMWHMVAETDLRASFKVLQADGQTGTVDLIDDYTFRDTGQPSATTACSASPTARSPSARRTTPMGADAGS